MRTPIRFKAETKYTEAAEKKANTNIPMMAVVGDRAGGGVVVAVPNKANFYWIRLLGDDNRVTQCFCPALALSADDRIYVAKASDRKLTWYEFVSFIQDADGETEVPVCPKFAQVIYVSVNGCHFATLLDAVNHIKGLPAGSRPAAGREFMIEIQAGTYTETGDIDLTAVTAITHTHIRGQGEATIVDMGDYCLTLNDDCSLESAIVTGTGDNANWNVVYILGDDVTLREVRVILTVANTCVETDGVSGLEIYHVILESTEAGAYGFYFASSTVLLWDCKADDANFDPALYVVTAGTVTTKFCEFRGDPGGDDIVVGAGPTWEHFCCNFDPDNITVAGTETPLTHGKTNFDDVVTFEDGFTFDGVTGGHPVTLQDNYASALHFLDNGVAAPANVEYLRFVTTNAAQRVWFNPAGVDVDFLVAASVADAFEVRGSDSQITLGVLTAGYVKSDAAGVLSVALEVPLIDLGSYTQGDLIYGGAGDWQDLAHPGAGNRVLQSTAAEVGWSANAVTFPAAGTVPVGTGGANQVAYWTGANTLAGDAGMTYNAAADTLTIAGDIDPTAASGQDLGDATHRWDLYTQDVIFGGASGANIVTIPTAQAIALQLVDTNAIEYWRIDTDPQLVSHYNFGELDIDTIFSAGTGVDAIADPTYALVIEGLTGQVAMGRYPQYSHLEVYNNLVNTTTHFRGITQNHIKTSGATTEADDIYGIFSWIEMSDADSTIGHLIGLSVYAQLTDGTIGDGQENLRGASLTARMAGGTVNHNVSGFQGSVDLDAGVVADNVYGIEALIDIEAAVTSIGGNVMGISIYADVDQAPVGSVFMVHLDEASGIDYCLYQTAVGTPAPSYLGGRLAVGGTVGALAQLHVDQSGAAATIPVLLLDQGDASEPFTNYVGTSAANAANSISTWTTGNNIQGHFQIDVNGTKRWLRFYDDPTS